MSSRSGRQAPNRTRRVEKGVSVVTNFHADTIRHPLGVLALCILSAFTQVVSAAPLIPKLKLPVYPPRMELPDLDGRTTTLAQFEGKVVAINFWATWCAPCREELPSMESTYQAFEQAGFIIIAVNLGETRDAVAAFLDTTPVSFPVLLDQDAKLTSAFKARGLPTTYFIDRHGRISHRIKGGRDWNDAEFRKELRAIMN